MEEFNAAQFMRLSGILGHHYKAFIDDPAPASQWHPDKIVSETNRKEFSELYSTIEQLCRQLGLVTPVATLKKMQTCLERPGSKYREFFSLGPELDGKRCAEALVDSERVPVL